MKTSRSQRYTGFVILFWLVSLCTSASTYAGSATWKLNPVSDDWNDPRNWTPNTVPNSPSDIATFDVSNQPSVTISDPDGDQVDHITFTENASAFTITVKIPTPPFTPKLMFYGTGIINQSGVTQNFVTTPFTSSFGPALIEFHNGAAVGENIVFTNTSFTNGMPTVEFFDSANAGTATFITEGSGVNFNDNSSAANAVFTDEAQKTIQFFDNSTAANGIFVSQGAVTIPL